MSVIAVADFNYYADKLAAAYLAGLGTSGSGLGLGDNTILVDASAFGLDRKCRDILNHLEGLADPDQLHVLFEPFRNAKLNASAQMVVPGLLSNALGALNAACAASGLTGVISISTFSTYWNLNGPSTALLAPEFSDLMLLVYGARPTLTNVYSPAISNMATKVVGGSFTGGTPVNTALYGGAALVQLVTSSFAGSSGLVTVTGTNQSGQTGRTWTVTVAANGTQTMTPTVATDLLVSVQSITLAGTITASTAVQVNGIVPAGRTAPPQ